MTADDPLTPPGEQMHGLTERLWPLNRSITGNGVRETLAILAEYIPGLAVHEIASGSRVFDWTVPDEWNVRGAWIEAPDGRRVADFAANNLHLVGYSVRVDTRLSRAELEPHLHSLPEQPEAIPYVTSYYSRGWGFCLSDRERRDLPEGEYRVVVDSTLAPGALTYGEVVIPGEQDEEVFLSTYVCHPSMANNELSGPTVTTYLARWLGGGKRRRYTYRIAFVPETIGSIAYLSSRLEELKEKVIAGFNITCIGDDRCYSFLPSRAGDTLSDRAARHVLGHLDPEYKQYTYLDRGSDERQYCAPGVDLPIASIMRSKYGEYPEYHTSLDDLQLVTPSGLEGGFRALRLAIEAIEHECSPRVTILCEPQLGKRGLYPTVSKRGSAEPVKSMMDMLAYCDGKHGLLKIAEIIGVPVWDLAPLLRACGDQGLLADWEHGAADFKAPDA